MSKRDVSKLVGLPVPAKSEENDSEKKDLTLVSLHYPRPTMLTNVLDDIAHWSEFRFVLDPTLDRPLQIFAAHKMPKDEAFHVFSQSLESIGLRVLHLEGGLIKIVAKTIAAKY